MSRPGDDPGHFVSDAPWNPAAVEELTREQQRYFEAPAWKLMWWRFRRHKLALISLWLLGALYLSIFITEFLAPYSPNHRHIDHLYAPPQGLHLFHEGSLRLPFVYPYKAELDLDALRWNYQQDRQNPQTIRLFCRGDHYRMLGGVLESNLHLFCAGESTVFLLGTDRLGRDQFSRILFGTRVSLTVGLVGITVSFLLGILLGGMAGYFGGWVDFTVQRVIAVLRSLPELPLWMALSAALPVRWDPILIYFGITIILGLLDWTGLARAVRSKLLSLREEEYTLAAEMMGASPARVIGRHLLPNFTSHLIASATLSIPGMILGETALSFLGLGLRPPVISWGVLLVEAQNINVVALYPWLMMPVVPVVVVVLAFNFLGDGLRDAADPYV